MVEDLGIRLILVYAVHSHEIMTISILARLSCGWTVAQALLDRLKQEDISRTKLKTRELGSHTTEL